ncbi:TPM domain-containing protein [Bacillus sp. V3B]|uniref:TPM domain-containing protein n=1 Tax=Bacillus sp. V3B TaxID=2804915 RepID=UPI002108C279|nr:TPM domain-containing protein [Bacillus sp. V3B]MCQ6275018.1 TPM domain-containing protein [Bacillus sp. V3B]
MKLKRIFSMFFVLFTAFLFSGGALAADTRIPAPVGDIYIQDFAHVLTEQEKMELRSIGRSIEDQTTAQIVVLTVDTIGDQMIEEFVLEVFREYGIGSEEEENGVLLVLGINAPPGERPLRIEVGYGLEGRLPDGKVGRILDDVTMPYLQNEEPNKAIMETYKVLANEVLAEYGIEEGQLQIQQPVPVEPSTGDGGLGIPPWLLIIIVVVVLFLDFKFFGGALTHILLMILSRGRGGGGGDGPRGGGGGSSGGGGASRGW